MGERLKEDLMMSDNIHFATLLAVHLVFSNPPLKKLLLGTKNFVNFIFDWILD
ncbi:MAG: hypothetical protein UV53_C0007G0013 [Candidatus Azambacteria bacterium GW2011_GWE1_42_9]|nr:MAG: hypothetical protein UV53_C0007G0013 [Candidatus Azambacteria bacterium GW2011_GWE1_42_9]KKT03344.1 MAG: hypothetical protein UV81_C0002G0097 [Candidatus Azambacteria bacterium GW2011_GWD1_43_18]KKT12270.1 MAG: hypothetical protein UV93_C0005G0025 [Candidatus Azambacteria bacterium GW2011_GWC2_43_27]